VKVYVTGIAGFLGSHLADHLADQGHEVLGCDDLSTGTLDNLNTLLPRAWSSGVFQARKDFFIDDIANLTPDILSGSDVVYHLAAAAYEGVSSFSPAFISRNIYAGSAAVFSAAIAAGVRRIVFCSSMARYGDFNKYGAFVEEQRPFPVDPYGIAKEAAERLLINLCETHGVEYSIAVPHNIYGSRQRYDDPYRNVAAIMTNRMLRGEQPIIYGDGLQQRCFSHVHDVVPCLARMGFDPAAAGQVINLGPDGDGTTILDLAHLLADVIGVRCDPIFLPPRPREVRVALCSADKARGLLGFEQRTDLRAGLIELVGYVRDRGPREFRYHLPIEIESPLTPTTWLDRTL
jgi:UDP-glucose 4-epimerase